jgi:hypothetical protein
MEVGGWCVSLLFTRFTRAAELVGVDGDCLSFGTVRDIYLCVLVLTFRSGLSPAWEIRGGQTNDNRA